MIIYNLKFHKTYIHDIEIITQINNNFNLKIMKF